LVPDKPFNLISKMRSGRYLTLRGKNFVIQSKNNNGGQTFMYDSKSQTIVAVGKKGVSMDIQKYGRGANLQAGATKNIWHQKFTLVGEYVVSERGKVIDVSGGRDRENQNVIVWKRHRGLNQKWRVEYVQDAKPEPKKGQLNKDFGLYVLRPFHVVSLMRGGRYLETNGGNVYIS